MRYTRPDASVESSDTIDDPIQVKSGIASYARMVSHVLFIRIGGVLRRATLSDLSLPPQALWT